MEITAIKCDMCGKLAEQETAMCYDANTSEFEIRRYKKYHHLDKDVCSRECLIVALDEWFIKINEPKQQSSGRASEDPK